jgi:hypothetical protein
MRQYTVDDKGVEHIIRLSIENSYFKIWPSLGNIYRYLSIDTVLWVLQFYRNNR